MRKPRVRPKGETPQQKVERLVRIWQLDFKNKDKKIAMLEARVHMEQAKHKQLMASRTQRVKKTKSLALFMPKFSEGKAALADLTKGTATELQLNEQDQAKVMDLIAMLHDPSTLALYTTWELRAVALQLTPQRLFTLRQTRFYKENLIAVTRMVAAEQVAKATSAQGDLAEKAFFKGSSQAYKGLGEVAQITGGPKSVKMTQNNLNFDTELRKIAAIAAAKVIDVQVLPKGK